MILTTHIFAALLSLIFAAVISFRPTKPRLYATYGLTAVMLITGFNLVLSKPVHMTETCITGLVYLGLVTYGLVTAHRKLALQK